ncbi:MAG: hypothetical protein ACT4PJ_05045 [Gemmatimonadaceae bacterium]
MIAIGEAKPSATSKKRSEYAALSPRLQRICGGISFRFGEANDGCAEAEMDRLFSSISVPEELPNPAA